VRLELRLRGNLGSPHQPRRGSRLRPKYSHGTAIRCNAPGSRTSVAHQTAVSQGLGWPPLDLSGGSTGTVSGARFCLNSRFESCPIRGTGVTLSLLFRTRYAGRRLAVRLSARRWRCSTPRGSSPGMSRPPAAMSRSSRWITTSRCSRPSPVRCRARPRLAPRIPLGRRQRETS
jgi:hypothetical protein